MVPCDGLRAYRMQAEEHNIMLEYSGLALLASGDSLQDEGSITQIIAASTHTPTCASIAVPVHRLKYRPCSGCCVASPGLPSSGSCSELAGTV